MQDLSDADIKGLVDANNDLDDFKMLAKPFLTFLLEKQGSSVCFYIKGL